jgi:HAD superfamily hydrolase (TIGR01549 family)
MKVFEGIIFDVDGTLTSTLDLIHASFNYVTSKYMDKELSKEDVISLFGPTEDVILQEWFTDNLSEVQEDYYKYYRDEHHTANAYEGIEEILILLKEKNIPVGIYTGKGRRTTLITLEVLGLEKYFDLIVTGDDVNNHKPSGEGIIKFINEFGLDKEKVIMIGDSLGDIKASREAGVKIASVVWDSYAKEEVMEAGSDYVFHSTRDLKDFLKERI